MSEFTSDFHLSPLLQVKVWTQEGAELFSSSGEDGSVVLGVLEESVFSLTVSGLVRIYHPLHDAVETQLENSVTPLSLVKTVVSPKRGKVFVSTREGVLHQVRQVGRTVNVPQMKHLTHKCNLRFSQLCVVNYTPTHVHTPQTSTHLNLNKYLSFMCRDLTSTFNSFLCKQRSKNI